MRIVKKEILKDKQDTYNLEVKDTHNFIANGVVVHNSIDATRYALSTLMYNDEYL